MSTHAFLDKVVLFSKSCMCIYYITSSHIQPNMWATTSCRCNSERHKCIVELMERVVLEKWKKGGQV